MRSSTLPSSRIIPSHVFNTTSEHALEKISDQELIIFCILWRFQTYYQAIRAPGRQVTDETCGNFKQPVCFSAIAVYD
ncbi:hypothetical protein Y032_0018g3502 [Ancylostoma ceylanicum]|uniref:Uncharacterized protein n=1 Tax=Ancylostoma ceylanicum TaxID=53326 RepID=A0A016V402_9BILA|nr:hypothetical protein Y032_0018g3502 [Ancylostoma ceylanicum]